MMHLSKQRKGFSILTAIVVIVTMALLSAYVFSTAGKTIKITTDQYRVEQAMLLAKSYTEYAIMAVSANAGRPNAGGCLEDINANVRTPNGLLNFAQNRGRGDGYRVRVRISYIGDASINTCAATRRLDNAVVYASTPLNIIVDTYVDYNDLNDPRPDDADANAPENAEIRHFTYHRRSLQKI